MWSELFAGLSAATLVALWSGAVAGGIASGAAGFAAGVVASAVWLHAIAPIHVAVLVVVGGLAMQCTTLWTLRHSLNLRRLWPFILAGVLGVPFGVWLLVRTDPAKLKVAIGIFLIVYAVYALAARRMPHVTAGRGAEIVIGFISGIMGGLGGYNGVLPAVWTQLRGWSKEESRAFYQPFIVAVHIATIAALGTIAVDREGLILLGLALPPMALGTWIGWKLYGRLDEVRFRQTLAVMLLVSGAILVL
jgi:uncharacterized membrane protein YfcA